jgi:hypothetical protein
MANAFVRNLAYHIDALFFGAVGYNSMEKSSLRQRYGDVWADTIVVNADELPEGSKRPWSRFLLALMAGSFLAVTVNVSTLIWRART